MKIRTRLTVWYGVVLVLSLLAMGGGMYFELVVERREAKAHGLPKERMEEEVAEVIFGYGLPCILLAVVGGWWIMRRCLAPLDRLAERAELINMENLREVLPCSGNGDEIDRLGVVLNRMTKRLELSFLQMRDFSIHASHEMKTPLAILQGEVEMCMTDPEATPRQREAYLSLLDEIQRLTRIVTALAYLARVDAGQVPNVKEQVRLEEVVREAFEDAEMLGSSAHLRVSMKHCEPLSIVGDRHRLRQLLLNLVENAIKYNIAEGSIELSLTKLDQMAELAISNTGPGIPAEKLPRVFERFFRGSPADLGEVEGCGLGLSIAEAIVNSHCGTITIESTLNAITTVTVRFPLHGSKV
ncbi:MAG: HAMP domain-containing protein [Verrucomicrobiales bacterium]|nr:HAMP domain-containing protein [Verrucomicrobiales bacterium]